MNPNPILWGFGADPVVPTTVKPGEQGWGGYGLVRWDQYGNITLYNGGMPSSGKVAFIDENRPSRVFLSEPKSSRVKWEPSSPYYNAAATTPTVVPPAAPTGPVVNPTTVVQSALLDQLNLQPIGGSRPAPAPAQPTPAAPAPAPVVATIPLAQPTVSVAQPVGSLMMQKVGLQPVGTVTTAAMPTVRPTPPPTLTEVSQVASRPTSQPATMLTGSGTAAPGTMPSAQPTLAMQTSATPVAGQMMSALLKPIGDTPSQPLMDSGLRSYWTNPNGQRLTYDSKNGNIRAIDGMSQNKGKIIFSAAGAVVGENRSLPWSVAKVIGDTAPASPARPAASGLNPITPGSELDLMRQIQVAPTTGAVTQAAIDAAVAKVSANVAQKYARVLLRTPSSTDPMASRNPRTQINSWTSYLPGKADGAVWAYEFNNSLDATAFASQVSTWSNVERVDLGITPFPRWTAAPVTDGSSTTPTSFTSASGGGIVGGGGGGGGASDTSTLPAGGAPASSDSGGLVLLALGALWLFNS